MNLNDLMKMGMSALGGGQQTQGGLSPDALGGLLNQVLGAQGGGLNGLIDKFNQAGMGEMIKAWVSTGPNPEISADQLRNVLGNDTVGAMAKQLGIDPSAAMGQLSAILPGLVDKMTPDGVVPPQTDLQGQLGGLLGQLLGGQK
ncbi:MAG TPA: hypothetical protein DCL54_10645 [Alphaproteobacteria bacterium]|nr:hypothetical protein [Alphaproteobacteria bacterium]